MKNKSQATIFKTSISGSEFIVHFICAIGLGIAFSVTQNLHSATLIANPSETLFLIWAIQCPIVIFLYSRYRQTKEQCSYLRAVFRGIIGFFSGALVIAFGAIALGAPISSKYLSKTINWSLAMSSFTIAPAASVFGSSWSDWKRIFAITKAFVPIDFMICMPAHGAIIGAWFGALPMPLDWERQWQEWPICVSYGAISGYVFGMVVSLGFVLYHSVSNPAKTD